MPYLGLQETETWKIKRYPNMTVMHSPVDVTLDVVPHQFISPMLSMIAEDRVLAEETTSAPVGHLQLITATKSITPDQKRFWLGCTSMGSKLK